MWQSLANIWKSDVENSRKNNIKIFKCCCIKRRRIKKQFSHTLFHFIIMLIRCWWRNRIYRRRFIIVWLFNIYVRLDQLTLSVFDHFLLFLPHLFYFLSIPIGTKENEMMFIGRKSVCLFWQQSTNKQLLYYNKKRETL